MLAVVVRRILQSLLVLVVVSIVSFLLFRFVGDPVNNMVGADTTADIRAAIRARLGLDEPIWVQFLRFAGSVLTGDFGLSLRNSQPVARLIAERLPATLELSFAAALIALVLGIPAGVLTALRPRAMTSRLLLGVSLFGISLPTFVTGILLVYVFGVRLGVLPTFGRGETVDLGWWSTGLLTASGWRSLILPAFTLGLFQLTLIMRLVRAEMLGILRSDFIRFARARGLSDRLVHFRHALRSALIPVITVAGLQFGALIAFSIVTESVFQWPGLGLLFIQAVQFADVPVMAAYLLLVALIFVAVNLLVDVLYLRVDPRLRVEGSMRSGAAA